MTANKVTKKELLSALNAYFSTFGSEYTVGPFTVGTIQDGLTHELELLEKRASKSTSSKTKVENLAKAHEIVADLGAGTKFTISEVSKATNLSSSKVTAIVRLMEAEGLAHYTDTVKNVRYFVVD